MGKWFLTDHSLLGNDWSDLDDFFGRPSWNFNCDEVSREHLSPKLPLAPLITPKLGQKFDGGDQSSGGNGSESGETGEKREGEGKELSVWRRRRRRETSCGRVGWRTSKVVKEVLADLKMGQNLHNRLRSGPFEITLTFSFLISPHFLPFL